jgi:hypothetical protein
LWDVGFWTSLQATASGEHVSGKGRGRICDGAAFEQAVKDALENKEGSKLLSTSVGKNEAGQVVAEFHFTWTFKAKNL